jgi:4-amino-4-deoxy-L-arabinose transferase-like glycosyltransferase
VTALISDKRRVILLAVPIGLLVIAALLRLPNLAARGTWDSDQGHDMLVLRQFVQDGVIPLLGPPTSIGDVHHGALYYYLLAPAAFLTGGDSPLAVVLVIALAGIAAVLVTWWLARDIAGPVAGVVAGLGMAISASAVDESTFIWNPNLIALSSAIALAGAWRAWSTGRPRWWLVAGIGTAITMQCHVLGVTLLPIVAAPFVADARRRTVAGERRRVINNGLGALAIIVLAFVPLAIHELTTNFSEVQAALAYLRDGSDPNALNPVLRFFVIGIRVASWPLSGLITDAPIAALVATVVVIGFAILAATRGDLGERQATRWLGLGLVWTAAFLTFASPSLATVVPGLPNDHYHAFADPMVFTILGIGAALLWRSRSAVAGAAERTSAITPGRVLVVVLVVAFLGFNLVRQPPAVHPDGGFPAADAAAQRIIAAGGNELTLRSIPDFKSTEAYAYPLVRAGASVNVDTGSGPVTDAVGSLVVVCDSLFETVVGAPCGGSAEATVAPPEQYGDPVDRFEAAPGRTISIYRGALAAR